MARILSGPTLWLSLFRTTEAMECVARKSMDDAGLGFSDFTLLEALLHLGPLHQRELATKILRTHGNVTLVVDHLEKRGLVRRERGSTDRRYIRVHLTPEGDSLVRGLFPAHAARLAEEMSVLDESEQRELGRLCRCLMRQATELVTSGEMPVVMDEAEGE